MEHFLRAHTWVALWVKGSVWRGGHILPFFFVTLDSEQCKTEEEKLSEDVFGKEQVSWEFFRSVGGCINFRDY